MTTQTLDYRHGDTACRGHLVLPQASGARPGIVIFHEAPGLNDNVKRRAAMLADLGYVALGADMYGGGTVAKDGDEAMRLMGGLREDTPLLRARAARPERRGRRGPRSIAAGSPPSATASAASRRSSWRAAGRRSPASSASTACSERSSPPSPARSRARSWPAPAPPIRWCRPTRSSLSSAR
jgi:hypothetical protein